MELLEPNWKQIRPTAVEVHKMCGRIQLTVRNLSEEPFDSFLQRLRESHVNGGAYLAAFDVGADSVFDWFASRNRLTDENLLDGLLSHPFIGQTLPELLIPSSRELNSGLTMTNQFLLDGALANALYRGGAYHNARGDGREEKTFSLKVCEAMFGLRFGEISCYMTYQAWTPWFKGIAWDLTAVLFDRRTRNLWIAAITDSDIPTRTPHVAKS
jgi:hypothetical protein